MLKVSHANPNLENGTELEVKHVRRYISVCTVSFIHVFLFRVVSVSVSEGVFLSLQKAAG